MMTKSYGVEYLDGSQVTISSWSSMESVNNWLEAMQTHVKVHKAPSSSDIRGVWRKDLTTGKVTPIATIDWNSGRIFVYGGRMAFLEEEPLFSSSHP